MDHTFKLHGFHQAIITDRDRIFTSTLWKELFKQTGVDRRLTTAYHPNRMAKPKDLTNVWKRTLDASLKPLPLNGNAGFLWLNSGTTPAIIPPCSPHRLKSCMHGYPHRHLGFDFRASCDIPSLQTWMDERKLVLQSAKNNYTELNNDTNSRLTNFGL